MKARIKQTEQEVRTGRIQEAMARYSLGRETMRRTAAAADAVIKIGKVCLFDFQKIDRYMESLAGNEFGRRKK